MLAVIRAAFNGKSAAPDVNPCCGSTWAPKKSRGSPGSVRLMLDKSGSTRTSADTGAYNGHKHDWQDPVALAREALAEAQASRRDVSETYIKSAAFSGGTNNCPQTKAYKLADERVIDARRHLNLVLAGSSSTHTRSKSVNLPINRMESSVPLQAVLKSPRRVGSAVTISVGVTRHCITRTKAKYPLSTMDTLSKSKLRRASIAAEIVSQGATASLRPESLPSATSPISGRPAQGLARLLTRRESSESERRRKSPFLITGDDSESTPKNQSRPKTTPHLEVKRFSQQSQSFTLESPEVLTHWTSFSRKARGEFISFSPSPPHGPVRRGQVSYSPF
jgi:hypothetical protein